MHQLFLLRHGESDQNIGINKIGRIPDHAVELTHRGLDQAHDAGVFLSGYLKGVNPELISMWVSPYKRTRQTAQYFMHGFNNGSTFVHHANVKEDSMLTELQFGIFDAIPKEDLPNVFPVEWAEYQRNRQFNGKYFARRPGGESPFDCEIRQKLWLDSLYRDIHAGTCTPYIIVVGHGAALTILRKAIFHYSHEWYAQEPNPGNCSIQSILLDPHRNIDKGYIYGSAERD